MAVEPEVSQADKSKPSGFAGVLAKITAALVALAALLGAADGFINQAESFTCKRMWSRFPWCDAAQEHWEKSPNPLDALSKYLKKGS
jgi:hypothetical protein